MKNVSASTMAALVKVFELDLSIIDEHCNRFGIWCLQIFWH